MKKVYSFTQSVMDGTVTLETSVANISWIGQTIHSLPITLQLTHI